MKARYSWSILVFVLIPMCISIAQTSDEHVEFMGDYSHIKSATGEHCEGYSVILWKYKESLVGFLYHHRGLCGDPPMGIIQETSYAVSTGGLSFNVKLSDGITFEAGEWVPTKDIITFRGKLRGNILKGVVSWYLDGKAQAIRIENIALKSENTKNLSYKSFDNYDEWIKYWGKILKLRGPQW